MNAPLYQALTALADENTLRMHMPGHKGKMDGLFSALSAIDFTEITPTGNLYTGEGPIRQAEALCAAYAGAEDALFFTCGSTQGIYAMLAAAVGMGGELILDRGCHRSVYQAMALLDITPHYLLPAPLPGETIAGPITPEQIKDALTRWPESRAVMLVSPTYYGVITDLSPIAALCHAAGLRLLVDQAHGAHFPSIGLPCAAAQGADLSVVSTHKTWPALGSSSVLYLGRGCGIDPLELKKTAMYFGTTSPSYPILASIDHARARLEADLGAAYRQTARRAEALRQKLAAETPFRPLQGDGMDPCRLTIRTCGMPGTRADELLQEEGIYAEMSDESYLVCILTCCDDEASFRRLYEGLKEISGQADPSAMRSSDDNPMPPLPVQRRSIRSAALGKKKMILLKDAVGCVSGSLLCPYPPGIPVIAPGEEITEKHIAFLVKKGYNIMQTIELAV